MTEHINSYKTIIVTKIYNQDNTVNQEHKEERLTVERCSCNKETNHESNDKIVNIN